VSADLEAADVQVHMDVTDIPFADGSFDVVVCNHVLEHVDDDLKALSELRRVVRPGGWAMIQVPLDPARAGTVEDPTISDPKLREELFGQHDHVRAYGRDYVGRLERAGFAVSEHDVADGLAAEDVQRLGLEQREPVYLARCV
jgi:SAM-dependent methyltransferase